MDQTGIKVAGKGQEKIIPFDLSALEDIAGREYANSPKEQSPDPTHTQPYSSPSISFSISSWTLMISLRRYPLEPVKNNPVSSIPSYASLRRSAMQ